MGIPAIWKGFCEQDGNKSDFDANLFVHEGRISGDGSDFAGKFNINGGLSNGPPG